MLCGLGYRVLCYRCVHFIISGGKDIAVGNYGPAWKLHRKLFTSALRQYLSDVALIESRVCEQIHKLLNHFEKQKHDAFDPAVILAQSVANVICGVTFGEGCDTTNPDMNELLDLNQQIMSGSSDILTVAVLDFFPLVEYLPIPAYSRLLALQYNVLDIIRKHLKQRQDSFDPEEPVHDLISGLIRAQKEAEDLDAEDRAALLSDDYLVNTIEDMFVAGYETTSTTLKWAIAFLVNYPQYQTDIQHQLDEVVGRDRMPDLQDRHNLPLVHATIMEVLRAGNVAPQAIPHLALNDTSLCGYRVPKDSVVIVDAEAVHLDPECWENPRKFDPYRHIDKDGNLITSQGNFYPFGAGRRVCAGEPLAKVELFLFLSWMLHKFTFVPEENQGPPELKGIVGVTQYPKPYKICAMKRQ